MKKILEIILSVAVVSVLTLFVYSYLKGIPSFWDVQFAWSAVLALCWVFVATGYYHQGWLVHTQNNSKDVSIVLPITVFLVQCILFVKGVHYEDWSLVFGAIIVNSGVVFNLYHILRARHFL